MADAFEARALGAKPDAAQAGESVTDDLSSLTLVEPRESHASLTEPVVSDSIPLGSRYRLHRRIGHGGMGEVWRGSTVGSGEPVAVKLLRAELCDDPDMVTRFVRERALLTRVASAHVVRVHELVVEGERLAIVMDLVTGSDLRALLRDRGTLPPAEAAEIAAQILDGLAAVHEAGVVHRDLKPENVLLEVGDEGMHVRLTDFGIARLAQGVTATRRSILIGTPEYMAPEVAEAEGATPASDLYAVGITLYELLAGRTPFGGGAPLTVLRRHIEAQALRPEAVPMALWAVIDRLLAKDPLARFGSAADAASALRTAVPGLIGLPAAARITAPSLLVRDAERPATAPVAVRQTALTGTDGTSGRPARLRTRSAGLVAVVAMVGLVLGTWLVVRGRSSSAPPPTASTLRLFGFSPSVLPNGIVATRSWSYNSASGDLTSTLHLVNPTSAPITGDVDEAIAKSLAATTASIRFSPAPSSIVQADPVVLYHVTALAASATTDMHYDIDVGAGAPQSLLEKWLADESAASAQDEPGRTLTTLSLMPTSIDLSVGATAQLTLAGSMNDGTAAPPSVLDEVVLLSTNSAVATVSGRTVTGIAAGSATVIPPTGVRAAPVSVTVTATPVSSSPPNASPFTFRPSPSLSTIRPTPTSTPAPPPTLHPTPPPTPTSTPFVIPTPTPPIPVTHYSCSFPENGNNITGDDTQPTGVISQSFVARGSAITSGFFYGNEAGGATENELASIRATGGGVIMSVAAQWSSQLNSMPSGGWTFSFGGLTVTPGVSYVLELDDVGPAALQVWMGPNGSGGTCHLGSLVGFQ